MRARVSGSVKASVCVRDCVYVCVCLACVAALQVCVCAVCKLKVWIQPLNSSLALIEAL